MSRGVVAFAGSRSFPSAFAGVVESAVASCVRVGDSVAVGCCVGVDALVLGVAPVGSVRCFAATVIVSAFSLGICLKIRGMLLKNFSLTV